MDFIKLLLRHLAMFENEMEVFGKYPTASLAVNIIHVNNFSILTNIIDTEKYRFVLLTMKHDDKSDFETAKSFSEINGNTMHIVKRDMYLLCNQYHDVYYDKSDLFNMLVSGELICNFDYEFYELFKELTDYKDAMGYHNIEIECTKKL